jgi:hypothetical protein
VAELPAKGVAEVTLGCEPRSEGDAGEAVPGLEHLLERVAEPKTEDQTPKRDPEGAGEPPAEMKGGAPARLRDGV